MLGGKRAVNVFVAELPMPALVELTLPLVFKYVPTDGATTSTVTVQVPPAVIVPPEYESDPAPAFAVTVPPHVVLAAGVFATTMCPGKIGKVSEKATPVRVVPVFGLVIVNVKVLVPPTAIGSGENDLLIPGGIGAFTVRLSLPVLPVRPPPVVDVTLPLTLLYVPAVGAVTSTVTVQLPPAAIVPPENEIDPAPATAVTVPPHVVLAAGVPATSMLPGEVGKVSLKATPARAVPVLGLVIVKVSVEVLPATIGLGVKSL